MMKSEGIPINKGNYSMDTRERESLFDAYRGEGWEESYNQYRHLWSELPRRKQILDYPLLVDLELASVCNLKCPMCYTISPEFRNHVNAKLMDYRLFTRVIDEIAGKVPAIRLSLRGEAFLHKRFVDCIRYAKERGIKEVSTLTNGDRLTGNFISDIIGAGIDWITISVDGVGATYEKIRYPITFDEILGHVREIHAYKRKNGLHRPVIKIQGVWPAIRENPQQYYDLFKDYVDLVAYNPLIDYLNRDEDIVYMETFTCPQQYQRLVIGADGLVMKCSNDEENHDVIGDINHETVHQVWHGERMNAVRREQQEWQGFMKSEVCRKCYLPRETEDNEIASIDGRILMIPNYVNRKQVVGE